MATNVSDTMNNGSDELSSEIVVLMVAEKPSIAKILAASFSSNATLRRGISPSSPVHEYYGTFLERPALFKVTSTVGHMFSLGFPKEYGVGSVEPKELFRADTVQLEDPHPRMSEHIMHEATGADALVLWLDCDREGENICFEVLTEAIPHMNQHNWPGAYRGVVFRAQFSSLVRDDLLFAMQNLIIPDENQSLSVDARQELDLKIGVAFSRYQTQYFRKNFGNTFGGRVVTYGPCQIPTLWFTAHRQDQISTFCPQPFWIVSADVGIQNQRLTCESAHGRFWIEEEADTIISAANSAYSDKNFIGIVKSVEKWDEVLKRPLALNTVEMLKKASDILGISPNVAIYLAETLYRKGIISYPRSETNMYPANFDVNSLLKKIAQDDKKTEFNFINDAKLLLSQGLSAPRTDGDDAGDHPPITPVKLTTKKKCGQAWPIYVLICRHFIASLSPDAIISHVTVHFTIGEEQFNLQESTCTQHGWMKVAQMETSTSNMFNIISSLEPGHTIDIGRLHKHKNLTEPPQHLTESELLTLMDEHGIGTDASMAGHIDNICRRKYCSIDEHSRRMIPTELGMAIVHAYTLIDESLVLPTVRSAIERECLRIAQGTANIDDVLSKVLQIFKNKFDVFCQKMYKIPLMMAVAFFNPDETQSDLNQGPQIGIPEWAEAVYRCSNVNLKTLLEQREQDVLGKYVNEGEVGNAIDLTLDPSLIEEQEMHAISVVNELLGKKPKKQKKKEPITQDPIKQEDVEELAEKMLATVKNTTSVEVVVSELGRISKKKKMETRTEKNARLLAMKKTREKLLAMKKKIKEEKLAKLKKEQEDKRRAKQERAERERQKREKQKVKRPKENSFEFSIAQFKKRTKTSY